MKNYLVNDADYNGCVKEMFLHNVNSYVYGYSIWSEMQVLLDNCLKRPYCTGSSCFGYESLAGHLPPVIQCLEDLGEYDLSFDYAQKIGYRKD